MHAGAKPGTHGLFVWEAGLQFLYSKPSASDCPFGGTGSQDSLLRCVSPFCRDTFCCRAGHVRPAERRWFAPSGRTATPRTSDSLETGLRQAIEHEGLRRRPWQGDNADGWNVASCAGESRMARLRDSRRAGGMIDDLPGHLWEHEAWAGGQARGYFSASLVVVALFPRRLACFGCSATVFLAKSVNSSVCFCHRSAKTLTLSGILSARLFCSARSIERS